MELEINNTYTRTCCVIHSVLEDSGMITVVFPQDESRQAALSFYINNKGIFSLFFLQVVFTCLGILKYSCLVLIPYHFMNTLIKNAICYKYFIKLCNLFQGIFFPYTLN